MSIGNDLKILWHLALSPITGIRGKSHQERLDSFYGGQAEGYDAFREHLLKGRKELYESLPVPENGVWIEMGGGTAHNLQYLGERISRLAKVYVVDLSTSLLKIASRRIEQRGWTNVELVEADVTTFTPPQGQADVVTFSYSLTMIPDWFAAIEQAERLLRPGGTIGVVDFYVARKYPQEGHKKHGWITRSFWPSWMSLDNVFPSPDHVPYLHRRFEPVAFHEYRTRMRYFPIARVPYYTFVGRKR
jgi:S-adenosylmethionine-diacylgycerolhomoserine-N-methlytransferase